MEAIQFRHHNHFIRHQGQTLNVTYFYLEPSQSKETLQIALNVNQLSKVSRDINRMTSRHVTKSWGKNT